jgi:hypothetical protein
MLEFLPNYTKCPKNSQGVKNVVSCPAGRRISAQEFLDIGCKTEKRCAIMLICDSVSCINTLHRVLSVISYGFTGSNMAKVVIL